MLRKKNSDFKKNFLGALPGLQDLLGYHSTSAFHGIGKRKWLNIVKGKKVYCKALGLLEEGLQIEDHLFDTIESVVCQVYGFFKKPNVGDF